MAKDQEYVTVPLGDWLLLAGQSVEAITFQVLRGQIEIRVSETKPDQGARGWVYDLWQGERNIAPNDIGRTGSLIWVRALGGTPAGVLVDHA